MSVPRGNAGMALTAIPVLLSVLCVAASLSSSFALSVTTPKSGVHRRHVEARACRHRLVSLSPALHMGDFHELFGGLVLCHPSPRNRIRDLRLHLGVKINHLWGILIPIKHGGLVCAGI